MRASAVLTAVGAALALAASGMGGATMPASGAEPALAPGVTAWFTMDEAPGATVMTDSGPNGLSAPVDPTGVTSGFRFDGATGYSWSRRAPEAYPPSPERVIQLPDSPALEPGTGPFTIEMRYRTSESYGNITQKGQSATPGGQWKIQAPAGVPSCLFKGSAGQVGTASKAPLNDERWHNLTCAYTSTGVTMWVDGLYQSRKLGTAGTIDNQFPMTIGGKIDCDQVKVTCDYFTGQIDFIKITKAANLTPTAAWTRSCYGLSCTFDPSASADPDGSLTGYLWDFGDGQTSTEATPSHTYASPGSHTVRLTVTDNQAATARSTQTVTVTDAGPIVSPIALVGSSVAAANTAAPTVTVPAAAAPGDRMLLVLSHNNLTRTVGDPTGVAGWTRLDSLSAGTMGTVAWTRVVQPGDPGSTVTVPLDGSAKLTLTLATYTGTATSSVPFAGSTFVASATTRRTPVVPAALGDWVVSYWADKSSTTTAWTAASSVTPRRAACNADGGRVCSLLADSGAALPPGPYGNVEASTDVASDQATMWSFVLQPSTGGAPGNASPTAALTSSCTQLDCTFGSSGSSDPDGTITSWAWDFGDGATSTAASPTHTYDAAGSYPVRLTVTDDDGATGSTTRTVTVQGPPVASPVRMVDSAVAAASSNAPRVRVPSGVVAGDRLVLALSVNSTAATVSPPTGVTGWTQIGSVTAGDMRTVVWSKVAVATDAGAQVTVPLGSSAKHTLTVAAYRGVSTVTATGAADTTTRTARLTPGVTAPEGAWVLSYWADKSSTTTAWSAPASVTARQTACTLDSGRICSLLADSGGPVAAGAVPGVTASTDVASSKATTWSVVLAPGT